MKITHKNPTKMKNNSNEVGKTKTNKIELLSKEMNLNHEIIIFHDIDYNNSIICMRMMLKGDNIIKKYKELEIKINEFSIKTKEKKTLSFPFKSKLTFNYTLTNDKNTISTFIKDAQNKREGKKPKSIFEQNEDEEDYQEESEKSDEINNEKDNNNNNKNGSNSNIIKIETNNDNKDDLHEKHIDFRKRLSIFQKAMELKNNSLKNIPNSNKSNKIINNELVKDKEIINKKNQIENNNKIINKIGKNNNQNTNNVKNETKPSKIENPRNNVLEIVKKMENKTEISKNHNNPQKDEKIKKNQISKDDQDYTKIFKNKSKSIDIKKSDLLLESKTIDLSEEYNLESFCKSFFICSFPYRNGKIMENSKNYRSICNHPICCKLLAMEPEIIFKYPPDENNDLELNNLSASICFPTGIKVCYNQDRRTIYKSFSTHIINQQGQKYYMTIYHFYRQLDSMSFNKIYSDDPLKLYLRQFGDNTYKNKAEKEKLERDLEECQELAFREYSYIPYAMALVSKYPYINQMKDCLNVIYKVFSNHKNILDNLGDNMKSSLLIKILDYLIYSVPIPDFNTEISFNMPLCLNKIKISSPYKENIRNLEHLNFGYILSKFCPENIIKIYQLILFEQKILFIDKDNNRLSTVIDSFLNILYPIEWVNTVIPIMSEQMTRYLQTFLPFINGISEDLFLNRGKNTLKEAEEGVFQIAIINDVIKFSKPNYEDDVLSSLPKLPNEIYKKLYSELSDLSDAYKKMTDKDKEKYSENINNLVKNIFLETVCIMLYGLMDYVLNNEKVYNGFSTHTLVKIYEKDANFYKELTDTQIFQNFIQNFISRKKDYSLFISMLKNITEKYIKSSDKNGFKWKKTIRNLNQKDLQQIPILFKIPIHLLNEDEKIKNYALDKKEWTEINNSLKALNNDELLSSDIIQESDRIASTIIPINNKLNNNNDKMERFCLYSDKPNPRERMSRMTIHKSNNYHNYEKLLQINSEQQNNDYIREESDFSKEEKSKITKSFKNVIVSLLKNTPTDIEICLNNIYYNFGRDVLCKSLYTKGFKVVKKLNEECFNSLNKICINSFISLNDKDESQDILEFSVKISSSAFCYCKEKEPNKFLIDELRSSLGQDYFLWNKKSFWNTWQHLENYFTINDYGIYCQVIIHDFINKLLRLKLDKDFIANYLVSSLAEKMILLEHTCNLNKKTITENQSLFVENRTKILDLVNSSQY